MKTPFLFFTACTVLSLSSPCHAVTEIFNFNGINQLLPDGNPTGYGNLQTVVSTIQSISIVTLDLNVSGTFNGDLYAYVSHGSGFSVLLNRTGKTGAVPFGYSDDGFTVTFSDTGTGDIHTYRNTTTPGVGSPLTGTWQPDARNVDPNLVTDLSPRTALLSSFVGGNANGDWTLFVADVSTGETHTVQSWSMTITGSTIPEPSTAVLMGFGLLAIGRRKRLGFRF